MSDLLIIQTTAEQEKITAQILKLTYQFVSLFFTVSQGVRTNKINTAHSSNNCPSCYITYCITSVLYYNECLWSARPLPGVFLLLVLCLLTSSSKRSHSAVMSMRANWRTFFMSVWERSWIRVTPRRHLGQITRWEGERGSRERKVRRGGGD